MAHLYWIEPSEFFNYEKTKAMDAKVTENLTFEISGGDTYFNADTNRTFDKALNEYSFSYRQPDRSQLEILRSFNGETRHIVEAIRHHIVTL